jgi:signal transduction histidine kinase
VTPPPGLERAWPARLTQAWPAVRVTFRPSVRLRLTLLYGGLFLAAGAGLLALTYTIVRANFTPLPRQIAFQAEQSSPGTSAEGVVQFLPSALGEKVTPDGRPLAEALKELQQQAQVAAERRLLYGSGVALACMALVSVGLGWVVAGRVLRPLQEITATAKRLSGQNLHERIDLDRPGDELKELADTFDAMLERLDAAFESQRRFVANASHELRTPLTIARTEVDVALANPKSTPAELWAMAERVRDATARSERLIESLLTLARSERELRARDAADLAEAAGDALSLARRDAGPLGIEVTTHLAPAPVAGDRVLLDRLVANLVENAVRHNQPGGWLEVATGRERSAWPGSRGAAFVQVANGGVPIPTEQVTSLFEPFQRLTGRTASADGAGLGLSIVRSVAKAHGGEALARALPHGGLEVTVRLPASG